MRKEAERRRKEAERRRKKAEEKRRKDMASKKDDRGKKGRPLTPAQLKKLIKALRKFLNKIANARVALICGWMIDGNGPTPEEAQEVNDFLEAPDCHLEEEERSTVRIILDYYTQDDPDQGNQPSNEDKDDRE